MSIAISNYIGNISFSHESLSAVAGIAATSCYGVIGMASKSQLKDGLATILKKENFKKGVVISDSNNELIIDLYVVLGYGVKISEIASTISKQVKYEIEKSFDCVVDEINIYVQAVKVME